METEQKLPQPSVDLCINKNLLPEFPSIDAARLYQDATDLVAVNRLCDSVLYRQSDGEIYFKENGTYIRLQEIPPLLRQMGCDSTTQLTSLVEPINIWLKSRAEVLKGSKNPATAIKKSDAAFLDFGSRNLMQTLADISGSRARNLTILDENNKGGILNIPPRSLIMLPNKADTQILDDTEETIIDIYYKTELDTHAGAAFVLRSSSVSEGVRTGATARVTHPRTTTMIWQTASSIELISHENRK